jgi:polo-like kinase 1
VGVIFCDFYKKIFMLLLSLLNSNVHFVDKDGTESYMAIDEYPQAMDKKMKLLSYFKRYMTEHLVKAGASAVQTENDALSRIPHLHTWFRTMCAVVMHLTNGTVQVSRWKIMNRTVFL